MNKQELASKIWEGANELRGKISASNYKDYMLGFIFYKFLSNKEEKYLREQYYFEDEDFETLNEENIEMVNNCQANIGYFIANENLYSYWLKSGSDFQIRNVREALSAFNRLIGPNYKKVYSGIFDTLEKGLDSFGTLDSDRTKAIRKLLDLINQIPVDGQQEYDVLGFVYEFLLKNFAANAGKAGEFYTPHEAATIMSEIISHHLKDRDKIKIYDPTSGSGSLLLNVGKSVAKYLDDQNKIQYYAQELIENTYNLTRMNLMMRGILPDNVIVRNGDTLADDWPFFDDNDKERTYQPVFVDACTSNPPYSAHWITDGADSDVRFSEYGVAPSSKADYAFLLHNLYHLKPDGIMTIVLPHGTLFRGGEEAKIRKHLIDKNNIETIIGLPANCFFGTGIPVIIMVLKKNRTTSDVLFVDGSKGFIKDGNKNKLRARDVRKIVDVVIERKTIDKFSRLVSKEEIVEKEYNLNIPRYVDSSEKENVYDLYSMMFGGIPNSEIDDLSEYWNSFPSLRKELFTEKDIPYSDVKEGNLKEIIENNQDVKAFISAFNNELKDLPELLKKDLIDNVLTVPRNKEETIIAEIIRKHAEALPLVDYYDAYQILDDNWKTILLDLEYIQSEGLSTITKVDENMVTKKNSKTKELYEVQDGWKGHILPFELVQEHFFRNEKESLDSKRSALSSYESEKEELLEGFDPNDVSELLKDDGEEIDNNKLKAKTKEIKDSISDGEIGELNNYLRLVDSKASKIEKLDYIKNHSNVSWDKIEKSKDGTYSKANVNKYLPSLFENYEFEDDDYKNSLLRIEILSGLISSVKKEIKEGDEKLQSQTKTKIESLSQEESLELLKSKWINPVITEVNALPKQIIKKLEDEILTFEKKYEITMNQVSNEMTENEKNICSMISDLAGPDFDMKGLEEFKNLLGGNNND